LIPLPSGWTYSAANSVNASGQVAGEGGTGLTHQAFLGTSSAISLIPFPAGPSGTWTFSRGTAVNDSGQVVGIVAGSPGQQAYIGTVSGSNVIPLPAGETVVDLSSQCINNQGIVVGTGESVGGWIWDTTNGTRLLNNLVPSGWNVRGATSISNNGLILAGASFKGGASQSVELIPAAIPTTPAPSTLALVLIGIALCSVSWVQHRRSSRKA
jgi:hypothetical protein